MSIETALRTELINDTDISAHVGMRVYPVTMTQGFTLPCISYQRISSVRMHTLSGPNGRVDASFQVDFYSELYSTVRDLADKTRQVLDGFKGSLGGTEDNVGGIHLVSDRDLWQDDTEVYRVTHDYDVFYFE